MAETTINKPRRFSRRAVTIFWCAIIAAVTIYLLAIERLDILYVLASISLIALLAIVALADLEGREKANKIENQ